MCSYEKQEDAYHLFLLFVYNKYSLIKQYLIYNGLMMDFINVIDFHLFISNDKSLSDCKNI